MELPDSHYYTVGERICLEQRTLIAATLISDGARYSEFGSLVLTQEQLGLAQAAGSPQVAEISVTDVFTSEIIDQTARESWLRTITRESDEDDPALPSLDLSTRSRNALLREGLQCTRDLYVVGRESVEDIRTVGTKAIAEIESALNPGIELGLRWKNRPKISEIVTLTHDLNEVNSRVLYRQDLSGNIPLRWFSTNTVPTVQAALDLELEEQSDADDQSLSPYDPSGYLPIVKAAAQEFATNYLALR